MPERRYRFKSQITESKKKVRQDDGSETIYITYKMTIPGTILEQPGIEAYQKYLFELIIEDDENES